MSTHHFLAALGVTVQPDDLEDDDILANTLNGLLLVTDKALNEMVPSGRAYLASVSPYGPILAFADDKTLRVQRFLAAVSEYARRDEQFTTNGWCLKAAVSWGPLQQVENPSGINFEGVSAIAASRLLAQLQPSCLGVHESAKLYWPPAEMTGAKSTSIRGKHSGEKYSAMVIPSYFGPPPQGLPRWLRAVKHSGESPRFLRRRCRAMPTASAELRALCEALLTERPTADERARALSTITEATDPFTACIGRAVYLESIGNIEQMLETLDNHSFTGIEECSRRLLRALALDKLDKCNEALEDIFYVLMYAPPSSELIVAAQFNAGMTCSPGPW